MTLWWAGQTHAYREKAESAMEQAFESLDIQEPSSRDMSKQTSTELDYKLATEPIQQDQKTFNLCPK